MDDLRPRIDASIKALATRPMKDAARKLFATLGYDSGKTIDLDPSPAAFLRFIDPADTLARKQLAATSRWRRVDFLFQLTNDEIPSLAYGGLTLSNSPQDYRKSIIESFVFLAMELEGEEWRRSELAEITREVNRLFPMPVVILFRHGGLASLSVIDRRPNKIGRFARCD